MGRVDGFEDLKTRLFQVFDDKNPNEFLVLRNQDQMTHVPWFTDEFMAPA